MLEVIANDNVSLGNESMKYASDELKNNSNFVLEAIKYNSKNFKYASLDLQNDKEFILKAVEITGNILEYISSNLKYDKQIRLQAVLNDYEYFYIIDNIFNESYKRYYESINEDEFYKYIKHKYNINTINDYNILKFALKKSDYKNLYYLHLIY
jgi:hypothetical protein